MKQLISALIIGISFMHLSCAAQVKMGNAEIPVPTGWKRIVDDRERINLLSPDERQQATISVMNFDSVSTFEDFKRACEHRLKAERTEASEVSITADEPFVDADKFGMYFSGTEKAMGRSFSGYLVQKDKQLITIYVESIGLDSKVHLQAFERFVKGLKWR